MLVSSFTPLQVILLITAGVGLSGSIILFLSNKEKVAVWLLVISALLVYLFAVSLDQFLNLWDERFHALVAKNMMDHPLKPTLYDDPVVSMAYDRWDRYHIWLHKQPLFLWQIALSFKLFGVSEFALRLPSVILGALFVLIGYRCGKLLVSPRTGFITGLLMITSFYFLELVAGRQEVDHNDVSFVAYVSLSLWALIEYKYSRNQMKWIFILLIGLFAGFAVLCKWLTGLLVYAGWFVMLLQERKWSLKKFSPLLLSLLVTALVVLPWQLLILAWYPAEAKAAYELNTLHFFESVDGHRGDFWFHFRNLGKIYGRTVPFFIIPSFIVLYFRMNSKKWFFTLLFLVVAVYLFFSLATTKMPSFTLIVSMIIFLATASMIDAGLEQVQRIRVRPVVLGILVFMVCSAVVMWRFDLKAIQAKHTLQRPENIETRWLTHNREVFRNLQLPEGTVLFNVKGRHYIEAMFYTGYPAYNFIPTLEQYQDMKQKGRKIAIFQSQDSVLPDFLEGDSAIIVIDRPLLGWD